MDLVHVIDGLEEAYRTVDALSLGRGAETVATFIAATALAAYDLVNTCRQARAFEQRQAEPICAREQYNFLSSPRS